MIQDCVQNFRSLCSKLFRKTLSAEICPVWLYWTNCWKSQFWSYEYCMDLVVGCVRPAIMCGKNFNIGHYMQTVSPVFSYLPCSYLPLTSSIVYHFHWPWSYLEVTRSVQSKTSWLHSLVHCSSAQNEFDDVMKQCKLNILTLLLSKTDWNEGNNCCLTVSNKIKH